MPGPFGDAGRPVAPHGIPGHLVEFVEALRAKGVAVGPAETVDAGRVLAVLDLLDREVLREGLACALLRRPTHREVFDGLFDLWFPKVVGERSEPRLDVPIPRHPDGTVDIDALRDLVTDLLVDGSPDAQDLIEALTAQIVQELGTYRSMSGPSYSAYQALKAVSPDTLLSKILDGLLGDRRGDESAKFENEVARRTATERIARFRKAVEQETRRRTAERLGRERVAGYAVPKLAEQVDFLRANDSDLQALRRSVTPLARLLASRLAARRRKRHRGEIDIRRTLRTSMSTGGVPIDLVQRKPRPGRPELVLLCDVSGSVAGFSSFTLLLVHALREQFSRVRVFAFVDQTDEVTRFFDQGADLGTSMSRMLREADVIGYDGHSDYGNALASFVEHHGAALTSRSSVLVLGDGRTNYRDPNLETLDHVVTVARHAHWLNPEPARQWGSGDSAADLYSHVIPMHECRTAAQLAAVVARLLPV